MTNLLLLLAQDPPAPILGVVIGQDASRPAVRIKFVAGAPMDPCVAWARSCFCKWTNRLPINLVVTQDPTNATVEIKG